MDPEEQTINAAYAAPAAQQLNRSRGTAMVLVAATVVSLNFRVFAFAQKDWLRSWLRPGRRSKVCRNSK